MMGSLHFVRPEFFFVFVPLILLLLILYRRQSNNTNWKTICDSQLLPYILDKKIKKTNHIGLFFAGLTASLCIIAAAGPAFEKLPKPVYREHSTLIILIDLSQSMDATDIKPTRLERAKLKLLDILKTRKAGQTALIVYASDAFTVTPLTDDTNTIANLAPTLETGLMPSQGSHAYTAIDKALQLLQQTSTGSGDILLMTDDITDRDLSSIKNLVASGHRLSILGIGTESGGPISLRGGFLQDNHGAIIIPKLNIKKLQQAALSGGGLYATIQAGDSDIDRLNKLFSSRKIKQDDNESLDSIELTSDIWQEEGPWLLLLALPLVALWARKGWILCFVFFILPIPEPAYALDLDSLWRNPDQKAMSLFKAGDAEKAAEQFQRKDWKASSYYRSGNYEKALEQLKSAITSDDYYNRGNALAQLGRYPEAIKSYDEALKLDANNKDAEFNRKQVEKILENQDSQKKSDKDNNQSDDSRENKDDQQKQEQEQKQDSENKDNTNQEEKDSGSENKDESESQSKAESQNEQKNKEDEPSAEQANKPEDKDETEKAIKDAQEEESKDSQDDEQPHSADTIKEEELSEDDQVVEQWLNRVPDNPEHLLRRKFLYQYKNMEQKTPSKQTW